MKFGNLNCKGKNHEPDDDDGDEYAEPTSSKIDQISNNIANVDTTAFKKTQTSFNNQPSETKEKGRLTAPGIRQGTGAMLSQSQLVLSQGALKTTDRNLDAAFTRDDHNFFTVSVQDDNGVNTRLTRDGALY